MKFMSRDVKIAATPWETLNEGLANEFCAQAEIAESLGFDSFWLPESHFGDNKSVPQPLTILAAIAARTSTIKLGTTSYLITVRNPLQAAEEVAVLDRLSGGRLILGLGRGVQSAMFAAFDLPSKDKRKRFKLNLDIMRKAWAGEAVALEDDGKPIVLAPLPVQSPHPPLWIAAFGPLALKQAGALGLPYLASPVETLEALKKNYALYNSAVAEHQAQTVNTVPLMRTIFVCDSTSKTNEVKQALTSAAQHSMRENHAKVEDWTIIGDTHYVSDKLSEYVECLNASHFIALARLPGLSAKEKIQSHEKLLRLAAGCRSVAQ